MPTRTRISEIEEIRDPRPSDFAGRLRTFRKERKMKQTVFAEKLGIDIQKCRRYEKTAEESEENVIKCGTKETRPKNGKRQEPDLETLKAMASILKISVDELVGYKPATIDIATGILKKAAVTFTKEADDDYVLYRYKTKEESDFFYFDPGMKELVPDDDLDPDLLEVYANNPACSFIQLPDYYGFRVYKDGQLYFPELPNHGNGLQIFTSLPRQNVLNAVAEKNSQNLKVFYNGDGSGAYEPRDIQDVLSNIKRIKLKSTELKACVFEAKRKTDAIIKTTLNATYAAFYPTVFWNYITDENYSTWSIEQIERLPEKFSERLRKLREINNISQAEMASEVKLSLQTYNRYETKGAQPSIDMLKQLALKLGISIDTLTGFKMDYINEALNFLEKVNITCTFDNKTNLYHIQVPGREPKSRSGPSLQFCTYQAKDDVDKLIAEHLKTIFNATFTLIFWELVDHHETRTPGIIIDENDYEPYLYELNLMNKPKYKE